MKKIILFYLSIFLGLLVSCDNPVTPQGGPNVPIITNARDFFGFDVTGEEYSLNKSYDLDFATKSIILTMESSVTSKKRCELLLIDNNGLAIFSDHDITGDDDIHDAIYLKNPASVTLVMENFTGTFTFRVTKHSLGN